METWKIIADFPDYEVSDLGNVRRDGRVLKQCLNGGGYYTVNLCKDGKPTKKTIHRLIAIAFIENPENKPLIDHIDADRKNNIISNLRWATYEENNRNCKCHGAILLKGVHFSKSKNKYQAKIYVNKKTKHLGYYETAEAAYEAYKAAAITHFGEFARVWKAYTTAAGLPRVRAGGDVGGSGEITTGEDRTDCETSTATGGFKYP